jgi:nucleoside-diphosphate-sugar epimerase
METKRSWTECDLEEVLSEPTQATVETVRNIDGDIIILGAGGKMGPTLSLLLRKAAPMKKIYAVSRFSDKAVKDRLTDAGIEIVEADLLDEDAYADLPAARNVYYLVGMKFGATGKESLTWAMNCHVPALVAKHYRKSRIVALSTGNVYPFVNMKDGGASESLFPGPVGEYAQSCLGRERIFQFFSERNNTPTVLIRLNYANEPRYGIIVDMTRKILKNEPIDLETGFVNLIWQGDANDYIARSIVLAQTPAAVLNVTGSEIVSVRALAEKIGQMVNCEPIFRGEESDSALLADAGRCFKTFGDSRMPLGKMVEVIVDWVVAGKKVLNKATKFEIRNGKF